jgi:hypothetical protein
MVFVTIACIISSTKVTWEWKTTCRHWCKTNFHNQIFSHMERGSYPLQIYKKLGFQETIVMFH